MMGSPTLGPPVAGEPEPVPISKSMHKMMMPMSMEMMPVAEPPMMKMGGSSHHKMGGMKMVDSPTMSIGAPREMRVMSHSEPE